MPFLNVVNRESLPDVLARLHKLTDDSTPQWGEFHPGAMLNHLRRALAASLGVTKFEDMSTWWLRNITCPRVMWGLKRIPKATIKLPEHFVDTRPKKVASEIGRFEMQLNDFLDACDKDLTRREMHPYFGLLPLKTWQRWHWLHFDHHFRQFGV